jgi:integrase
VTYNAAQDAKGPRQPRAKPTAWTPHEVGQFLDHVKGDRWVPFWRLAATTGMRRAELTALRWSDLDLEARRVMVSVADVLDRGRVIEHSDPKTERSSRTVHLDPATVEVVRQWRRQQTEERLRFGGRWPEHGRVFTWPDGSPLHPDVATTAFGRLVQGSGVPRQTLRGLRRSWATTAQYVGVPLRVSADRLGHDPSMSLTVYTASVPDLDRQAAELVAGLYDARRDHA